MIMLKPRDRIKNAEIRSSTKMTDIVFKNGRFGGRFWVQSG
jgi:hypothetical protein